MPKLHQGLNQKGFTLFETICAIIVSTIILVFIGAQVRAVSRGQQTVQTARSLYEVAQVVTDKLVEDRITGPKSGTVRVGSSGIFVDAKTPPTDAKREFKYKATVTLEPNKVVYVSVTTYSGPGDSVTAFGSYVLP